MARTLEVRHANVSLKHVRARCEFSFNLQSLPVHSEPLYDRVQELQSTGRTDGSVMAFPKPFLHVQGMSAGLMCVKSTVLPELHLINEADVLPSHAVVST